MVDLNVSTPQDQSVIVQVTRAFSFLALVYKLGWLQVSSKWFAMYFLKGTYLAICRNGIFCMWARLFVFLASYLYGFTYCDSSHIASYIQDLTKS